MSSINAYDNALLYLSNNKTFLIEKIYIKKLSDPFTVLYSVVCVVIWGIYKKNSKTTTWKKYKIHWNNKTKQNKGVQSQFYFMFVLKKKPSVTIANKFRKNELHKKN